MKGFTVRENELGIMAVRLHYSSDPTKDPTTELGAAWLESARRLQPDPNMFAQEFEINWWVAAGTRVFPEFTESRYCVPLEHRHRKVLYRAWDFGWHAPACLIGQIDQKDRLLVLHEVVGREQTTRDFAKAVIEQCSQWYPHHSAGFEDFCDPAGQQVSSTASERSEVRDVEVLGALGVYPKWSYGWSRKDGRALIHQLLVMRSDDSPSLYIDGPQCSVLLQSFLGKYVYPARADGQAHDEPDESNHPWSDVMASLRYLVTGLYTALGLRRFAYQPILKEEPMDWHGYGTPVRRDHYASE